VPAHNEAANIASCIQSLLASDRGGMDADVFVVADNCTDDTARIAEASGARVLTRTSETERGKGRALHFAFTSLEPLGYDCVLVVDADTLVAHNFIASAAGAMRDGSAAVQTRYLVRNLEEGIRTRLLGLSLCAFNIVRLRGRERLGFSVGLLGNGFGLRSATLRAVPYLASSVVEDLEYHLSLIQNGFRVRFVDETSVFGEMPVRGEGVKTQRSRWEGGRIRMIYEIGPKLLRGVLGGRLVFLEPLMELLLLPIAFHVLLLLVACSTPLAPMRYVGFAGLAVLVIHLAAAVVLRGQGWRGALVLLVAPIYVLWKLLLIPSMLRNARADQAWVRTKRNAELQATKPRPSSNG
jgi:cellulose synthase/poly-beta-1,6-N-acetylglucosamine synthase-like glycosyltransferase